jgi:S1-C subfamily serine protease
VDGILGFPFFARYRMTLDYQAMQLTFVPTDYQPADLMANMALMLMASSAKPPKKVMAAPGIWGLLVDKDAKDEEPGITVKQVLPGSAVESAGLKAGDRLLVLDGTWTDSLEDCYRAAKGVRPGKTARIKYARAGKESETTIQPNEGI